MSKVLDLGHGHVMRFASGQDGKRYFIDDHPSANSPGDCVGGSGRMVSPGEEATAGEDYWLIEQEEPLTLSPSLLCTQCGEHGFVRGGVWVPA